MKTLRISFLIIAMMLIAGVSNLNAQAERQVIDFYVGNPVECANDGLGEFVEGWISVLIVTNKNGYVAHPQGGYAVGSETGIKYQAVGATISRMNSGPGASTNTWVNRYHLVGKGTHFYVKATYHSVTLPNGDLKVTLDKSEFICK